jgi:hypothetical protein
MTLVVGPDGAEKEFQIYRGILCHHSKYFERMLNGGVKEAGSDKLRLAVVNVDAFRCFYCWANTGVIDCTLGVENTTITELWRTGLHAYLFSDSHRVAHFKNALLDYLFLSTLKHRELPVRFSIPLYRNTMKNDPLRRLMFDNAIQICDLEGIEAEGAEIYDKEFLLELVCGLRDRRTSSTVPKYEELRARHFCERYHDHSEHEAV